MEQQEEPKFKKIVKGADALSLGISMVVALLLGVAIGLGLKSLTGATWTLWIGVFIGVAASFLNVYKMYEQQKKEYEELKQSNPRYQYTGEDDDDDNDYTYSK
jgi:F0F1-type ATP synthase assembly protein I